MAKLKNQLLQLNRDLRTLEERAARYGGNVPLELSNQIEDYETAIDLTKAALDGEITEEDLRQELAPLNLALNRGSNIVQGDITGSIVAMGKGAQVIINQAQSALAAAQEQSDFEDRLLCEALAQIATNLQNQISPYVSAGEAKDSGENTFIIKKTGTLLKGGKISGSPYKSLLDYKLADAPLFYGRRDAIRELMDSLQPHALTILHAESGAGKSSLLQAGIASRLLVQGHLPLMVRPYNEDPATAIKRAFLPDLSKTPGLAEAPLNVFLGKINHVLGQSTLYIFLDQFEEFFTQHNRESQANFINQLGDALEDESLPVSWLIALRDEYFGQIATFSPRIRYPYENQYLLRPLTYEEATQVIIEPAGQVKVTYEETLVPQILIDLTPEEGLLSAPELQLVCSALFDNLKDGEKLITLQSYEDLGRANGILRNHLHNVLEKTFTPQERKIASNILETMVSSDLKRVLRTQKELVSDIQADEQTINQILQRLLDNRLIRASDDEADFSNDSYELAHDYLLTEIQIDPENQARKAAQELLARELDSYKKYGALLSKPKYDIIHSQKAFIKISAEEEAFLGKSRSALNRTRRNQIILAAVAFVLLIIFSVVALLQRNEAQEARHNALARSLASEAILRLDTDSELSLLLALEAIEQDQIIPAENTLRDVLLQTRPSQVLDSQGSPVLAATFSNDASRVALGLDNGGIQLWNPETNAIERLLTGNTEAVRQLAYHPNGDMLASATASTTAIDIFSAEDGLHGRIRLWDVTTGKILAELEGHSAGIFSLVWSPDGTQLASASADGTVKIWDTATQSEVATLSGHPGMVRWVDWHPTENKLASGGGNGEIIIWDLANGEIESELPGHQGGTFGLAWSPDGRYLASAGADNMVRLWDTATGTLHDILTGHKSFVRNVSWRPDGAQLASSSFGDNKIIVWDIASGQPLVTLTAHQDWIRQVSWNENGSQLLSASDDSTARIWEINNVPGVQILKGHTDNPNQVAWHANGNFLASAARDNTVRLWNRETGQTEAILTGHTAPVWSVNWSPNSRLLATSGADNKVLIWNIGTDILEDPSPEPVILTEPAMTLEGHSGLVFDTAWHPDGQTLASASADRTIQLWNVETGAPLRALAGHDDSVLELDFSPDGTKLASSSADQTAIIWDVATGNRLNELLGHSSFIWDIEFSPDGEMIATGSGDQTVGIWDVETGEELITFFHDRPVSGIAWNKESDIVASNADDGLVRLWDIDDQLLIATLTGHKGGVWNVAWSPNNEFLATAGADDTVRIFYTDFEHVLEIAEQYKTRDLDFAEWQEFLGEDMAP